MSNCPTCGVDVRIVRDTKGNEMFYVPKQDEAIATQLQRQGRFIDRLTALLKEFMDDARNVQE